MPYTQAQLDALEEAILSGASSVSYEGKSVTYRSIDEMLRLRTIMRKALGLLTTPQTFLAQHSRGIIGGGSRDAE